MIRIYFKYVPIVLSFVLILGCKTQSTVMGHAALDASLSVKQIVKNHQKSQTHFKTLVAKIKADYNKDGSAQGTTISLRMQKDKIIWMSAPFSMAKVLITPEKVRFYNKLDHTYFDGDFTLLSQFVGTDLDFDKVQNILLGQALFSLDNDKLKRMSHEYSYFLEPKKQLKLFDVFYLLNAQHFKMDAQNLTQSQENRELSITYKAYQEVDKQIIPQEIGVLAKEGNRLTSIRLEIKSVELNEDLRFPFNIPKGFKKIELL